MMIAYKGFTCDLTARLGKGVFQYEIGKTYTEKEAECASTGFHCVEEPVRVFEWYSGPNDRYCQVVVSKDIHEDGHNRISASRILIEKELTKIQLATLECKWLMDHPNRKYSPRVSEESNAAAGFAIARGKKPCAQGRKGDYLFLLQEYADKPDIKRFEVYIVDGIEIEENVYIGIDGKRCRNAEKG